MLHVKTRTWWSERSASVVELMVVLAVVLVVSTIALAVGGNRVAGRAQEWSAEISLVEVAKAVRASGLGDEPTYQPDRIGQAVEGLSAGGDVFEVRLGPDAESDRYGVVAAESTDFGAGIALAMRNRSGGCTMLLGWGWEDPLVWTVQEETGCTAAAAAAGPDLGDLPLVTIP